MEASELIAGHEVAIRLGFFIGTLLLMTLWEALAPRRTPRVSRALRWGNNLGMLLLTNLLLRFIFPVTAVGVAMIAAERGWGLFNHVMSPALAVLLSIIALDLVIYLQHVLLHALPVMWRIHRVHHADPDYDVTTGIRFHPFEICLSLLIKMGAIVSLGVPVVAVVTFELILNAMAMFNHGNVRLPLAFDRVLRWLVVTPDMHRVHHSVEDDEANSNFGFNLSLWDRVFGTYRAQPRTGHEEMQIGIHGFHDNRDIVWLPGILLLPFKGKVSEYAINRRRWDKRNEL